MRAIDSTVVDLINRAQDAANSGDNNTGNGMTQVNSAIGATDQVTGTLNFDLYPVSMRATARWFISGETQTPRRSGQVRRALAADKYTISFASVPGFAKPADRLVQVSFNQSYSYNATYLPLDSPIISSASSVVAATGKAFVFQVVSSNGANAFSATGLPPGLKIDAAGRITGTPTVAGVFAVTLRAHNAAGSSVAALKITVSLRASCS